jgi:phosphoribosyl 1,2-cyclic phosphodiesterase
MTPEIFSVKFWGVRGSLPVSGPAFQKFGGHTACIQVTCGNRNFLFDAGSGIVNAAAELRALKVGHVDLFFSHSHYDHILGLPYFGPLFDKSMSVDIWAGHLHCKMPARQMVEEFVRPPWVAEKVVIPPRGVNFHDFAPGDTLRPAPGVVITTAALNHPGGCVGYRIEWGGRSLALVYDIEHQPGQLDPVARSLMADADLVVYDSAYLDEEMDVYKGFGHSSWQQGVRLARMSSAKRILFFHHMPMREDCDILAIERAAQATFPCAAAARQNMKVEV